MFASAVTSLPHRESTSSSCLWLNPLLPHLLLLNEIIFFTTTLFSFPLSYLDSQNPGFTADMKLCGTGYTGYQEWTHFLRGPGPGAVTCHKLSALLIAVQELLLIIVVCLRETETSHQEPLTARPNHQQSLLNLTPHNLIINHGNNVYSAGLCLTLFISPMFKPQLGCGVKKTRNNCTSVGCGIRYLGIGES